MAAMQMGQLNPLSIYAQAFSGADAAQAQAQLAALQSLFSVQGRSPLIGAPAASALPSGGVAQGLPWQQSAAAGGFSSTAPSSAAGAGSGRDYSNEPRKGGRITCSVHGKERSIQSLMDDGSGGMRCQPGQECRCGATSGPLQVCSVHGKKRNLQSLTDDGAGGMRCAPGFECKGTGDGGDRPTIACSVHGKMRSLRSLIDDGQGGMRCAPGQECKGFGAPPELIARSPEDLASIGTPEHQQLVTRVKTLQRRGEDYRVLWTTWCNKPGEGGKKDPAGRTVEDLKAFLAEADPDNSTSAPVVPPPMWAPGAMLGGWDGMGGMLDGAWGMDAGWDAMGSMLDGGMMGKFGPGAGKFGMMGKGMGMMGKGMGMMGKGMGMLGKTSNRPMMGMDELVVRVKAVIRSDGGKELWHAFVDTHGGGKRDPANRTGDFLQAFLDDADPDYSISDAGMDDPEMRQQQLALAATPAGQAMSLPLATTLLPPLSAAKRHGPEHAHAIARVKAVMRTEGCEDYWPTWLARMGFTKQDPAAYRFEDLHLFLAEVDPNDTTIDVQVDEADMEKDRLVARVKTGQRGSEAYREAWAKYCEENGQGSRDPARHDIDFLNGFLAVAPSDQPPELSEEHMKLVGQVKALQRTNKNFQEAWWKHCDENGGGKRDPARHEADFLENILLSWTSMWPDSNQDGHAEGEADAFFERPAPQVVPPAAAWKGKGAQSWAPAPGPGGMKGGKQQWNRWNPY